MVPMNCCVYLLVGVYQSLNCALFQEPKDLSPSPLHDYIDKEWLSGPWDYWAVGDILSKDKMEEFRVISF